MKAVILGGGLGKRLRPLTEKNPKPLLRIAGKTILEWQIAWLLPQGISEFVVCAGHLGHKIATFLEENGVRGAKVHCVIEPEPLGTAGGLFNARSLVSGDESFIALNGDIFTDLQINKLKIRADNVIGSMALVPLQSPFGVVEVVQRTLVKTFTEKPILKQHWINAGVYLFKGEIFKLMPRKGSLELDVLPKLAKGKRLRATKFPDCLWRPIDSWKDLEDLNNELGISHRLD
ncbi:MAG: NDP-sugar synthase [Candidatus Bathyarchaeia archaeon]